MGNDLNLTDDQKELLGIKDERVDFYFKVENSVIDGYETEQLNEKTGEIEIVEKSYFDNVYELVVYTALSRYCNNGKVAFPSISTLARNCCCGTTSIKTAIKGLEEKGFLKKINRKKTGSLENDTNVYAIKNIEEIKKVGRNTTDVGRNTTDVGRNTTDVGRVASSKKNKLNKNNIKKTCKEELVPFEIFFKKELKINFTKTNQEAVEKLLKTMNEQEVKNFLLDNYKIATANKEKDSSMKSINGMFVTYLKKGERIPEYIPKEPKKEKVEKMVIKKEMEKTEIQKEVEIEDSSSINFNSMLGKLTMSIIKNKRKNLLNEIKDLKTIDQVKEFIEKNGLEVA